MALSLAFALASALIAPDPLAREATGPDASGGAELAWPAQLPQGVSASEVSVALARAGLEPDTLGAAGATPNSASAVVGSLADSVAGSGAALVALDADVTTKRAIADVMGAAIVAGTASDEEAASWPSVRAASEDALATRDALLATWFGNGISGLSAEAQSAAQTVRATAASWPDVPAPYRVAERTESEFGALRDALAAERIALARGREVPDGVAAYLAQVRAEAVTATALASWSANAPVIASQWEAAVAAVPPGEPSAP